MASPPHASPPQDHYYHYAQPPQKDFRDYLEQFIKKSTVAANLLTLACFVAFGLLIGCDVWRAFKKRAIWLPGKAFALSGVTVQIIVWWTSLSNIVNGYNKEIIDLVFDHYMVVVGRVAVCVFIAYLLPGMAAPSVRAFGALAVAICAQIASELLLLYNPTQPGSENVYDMNGYIYKKCLKSYSSYPKVVNVNSKCMKEEYSDYITSFVEDYEQEITWSKITDLIILICVVFLGLILCCTILASKTIHSLLNQRISAIAGESDFEFSSEKLKLNSSINEEERIQLSNEKTKLWNDFEDEVLRSWFVARVCRGDYVISRSVFSSAVWIIVTVCLIVFCKSSDIYYDPTIYPLCAFTVIAYVVICWRLLASQLYCPSMRSWRRHLCFEDFWTSRTVELINKYDLKRIKSKKSSLNKLQSFPTMIFTKVRLHRLLYLVVMLQMCVVFLSKVCGIISELTVGNIVYCCRRFVCVCQKCTMKEDEAESHEGYARILKLLCMPGEDTSALWEANRMPLNETRRLMKKGCKKGISCEEINSIFRPYSLQWEEKGTQLLKDLKGKAHPPVLSHFPSVEKHCLKMTVVSLMTILIGVHKAKSDRLEKVVKACHHVWDLLSFADECDIDLQADNIKLNLLDDLNEEKDQVLLAADREFYKLQMKYDQTEYAKLPSIPEDCVLDAETVHEFLTNQSMNCESILRKENLLEEDNEFSRDLHDSRNWTKIAPSYTLYKLCKFMLDENNGIENLVEWTEESLRNVIACSMSKLPNMLVEQCWKWAQEFEEDKLWEAIQLAGKCRGMMEEWGKDTKTIVNTREHKTLYQQFKMCILCCPREQQPNHKIDQYTIQVNEPSIEKSPQETH